MQPNSVFISHSSRDRGFAERLASDLKAKGMYVWYDDWELKVGDSFVEKISDGIKSKDHIIVVLSKESVKSPWVMKEINVGLIRELKEKRVVVLPVIIEDCDLPPLLADKIYADFRKDYRSGLSKLLGRFNSNMFVSGISVVQRKSLANNVHLENVITTNILRTKR